MDKSLLYSGQSNVPDFFGTPGIMADSPKYKIVQMWPIFCYTVEILLKLVRQNLSHIHRIFFRNNDTQGNTAVIDQLVT